MFYLWLLFGWKSKVQGFNLLLPKTNKYPENKTTFSGVITSGKWKLWERCPSHVGHKRRSSSAWPLPKTTTSTQRQHRDRFTPRWGRSGSQQTSNCTWLHLQADAEYKQSTSACMFHIVLSQQIISEDKTPTFSALQNLKTPLTPTDQMEIWILTKKGYKSSYLPNLADVFGQNNLLFLISLFVH